jgi:F0F1-type ATP synthase epsilon subunit
MEHDVGEGKEPDASESAEVPHVLFVIVGGQQHAFEMGSMEKARERALYALSNGFVEIENEKVYLLVGGPKSGTGFIIMSKADVMEQQVAAQRAQAQAQFAQAQAQAARTQLVRPNGR